MFSLFGCDVIGSFNDFDRFNSILSCAVFVESDAEVEVIED